MKKKEIVSKLNSIISEGTNNKAILESEKKALQNELNELMGPAYVSEASDEDYAVDREAREEFASENASAYIEDVTSAAMRAIEENLDFEKLYSHGFKNTDARGELESGIRSLIGIVLSGKNAFEIKEIPVGQAWIDKMRKEQQPDNGRSKEFDNIMGDPLNNMDF